MCDCFISKTIRARNLKQELEVAQSYILEHIRFKITRTRKTTVISPLSARETTVTWHHGVPLKLTVNHNTIVFRGLWWALNWAPIVPRKASLSDSGCDFLQSRNVRYQTL